MGGRSSMVELLVPNQMTRVRFPSPAPLSDKWRQIWTRSNVMSSPPLWHQWHSIEWSAVSGRVRRLQARIAKAAKESDWRKVRQLQRLITKSTSAKALAIKRVTANRGHKTPGIDGELWSTPEAKWAALRTLGNKGYKAVPLRRIHIPKASGGKRPLGIPTMRDRALYLLALEPVSETNSDLNSYGFRPHRSVSVR